MQTIHVYIDESGQDTEGEMFIVSVVVALGDPVDLSQRVAQTEQVTHKRRKWHKSTDAINLAFIRRANSDLAGLVVAYVEITKGIDNYFEAVANTTAKALQHLGIENKRAFVHFDGLPRTKERQLGSMLRYRGVHTYKVRGIEDEKEPLIRLADAICGLTRKSALGTSDMQKALAECTESNFVIQLGQ